jgi:hypothetical protein
MLGALKRYVIARGLSRLKLSRKCEVSKKEVKNKKRNLGRTLQQTQGEQMQEKKEFDNERGDSSVVLRMELLSRRHKRPAYAEIRG